MNPHVSPCECCAAPYVALPCWPRRTRTHLFTGADVVTTFTGTDTNTINPPAGTPAWLKLIGAGGASIEPLDPDSTVFGGGGALGEAQILLPSSATLQVGRGGPHESEAASHLYGGGARGGGGLAYGGGRARVVAPSATYVAGGGGGGGTPAAHMDYGSAHGGAGGIDAGGATRPPALMPPAGQPAVGDTGGAGGVVGGTTGEDAILGGDGGQGSGSVGGGGGGGYAGGGGGGEDDAGRGGQGGGGSGDNLTGWAASSYARHYDPDAPGSTAVPLAGAVGDGEHGEIPAGHGYVQWTWRACDCACSAGDGLPPESWLCLTAAQVEALLVEAGGSAARPTGCCPHYIAFRYQGYPYYLTYICGADAPAGAGARRCERLADSKDITGGHWTVSADWCCVQWTATLYDSLSCPGCTLPSSIYFCDETRALAGIPACLADVPGVCHSVEYQGLRYSVQQAPVEYQCASDHGIVTDITYNPYLGACVSADQVPTSFILEGQGVMVGPCGTEYCCVARAAFDIQVDWCTCLNNQGIYEAVVGSAPGTSCGDGIGSIRTDIVAVLAPGSGCCTPSSIEFVRGAAIVTISCTQVNVAVNLYYQVEFDDCPGACECLLAVGGSAALPGTGNPYHFVPGKNGSGTDLVCGTPWQWVIS